MWGNLTSEEKREIIATRISNDQYAPKYHFIAPEGNAMPFDPNGAIFWQGKYHLFYIFQDDELPHGGHCWGHASSTDLIHWTYHSAALCPAKGDPDKGIFSGNAFVDKSGIPTISYYGIDSGICLAQSTDDDLENWGKFSKNPVIPEPRIGELSRDVYNVFDPHIWLEDDTYYAILGANIKPHQMYDTAYLFQSHNLINWEYIRPFYSPNTNWTQPIEDCACPDFFELDDRYVLLCISHSHGTRYYLGHYYEKTFIPLEHHRMNWPGGPCFAPESLKDDRNRRIFWAWVLDQRKGDHIIQKELGVMTCPRVLSINPDGQLSIKPAEELTALRYNERSLHSIRITPKQDFILEAIQGECLELDVYATLPRESIFGIKVRMSPDSEEQTIISVDTVANTLAVDTRHASLRSDIYQPFPLMRGKTRSDVRVQTAPFMLKPGEKVRLRIYIDRSILEVFANSRQCITQRIYPTRSDSLYTALFCKNRDITVDTLTAWDMMPIHDLS